MQEAYWSASPSVIAYAGAAKGMDSRTGAIMALCNCLMVLMLADSRQIETKGSVQTSDANLGLDRSEHRYAPVLSKIHPRGWDQVGAGAIVMR